MEKFLKKNRTESKENTQNSSKQLQNLKLIMSALQLNSRFPSIIIISHFPFSKFQQIRFTFDFLQQMLIQFYYFISKEITTIHFVQKKRKIFLQFFIKNLRYNRQQRLNYNKMQNNSMQYESSSDYFSVSKVGRLGSEKDQSINFSQLAKMHLKNYQDIDEDQFQIIGQTQNVNINNSLASNKNYLKIHSTVVPIGTNFQADIPDIMAAHSYLYRKQDSINRLKRLKIHDPQQNQQFYNINHKMIQQTFGANRNYQQITCLKKCLDEYYIQTGANISLSLNQYLSNEKVYKFWQQQFKNKDIQAMKRMKKKKKKCKGSMDP